MKVSYRNKDYEFPDTLADITIAERIQFTDLYGKALDDKAAKIAKLTNAFEMENELNAWHVENAMCQFAFYTGVPLADLQKSADIVSLLHIYNLAIMPLMAQERDIVIQQEFDIDGEIWVIGTPELIAASKMTFNEFLHAKEIVRQFDLVAKGKWHSLPYLCAIYLRRPGEQFDESFVIEGSDRLQVMQHLPLDIAIAVGFFLTSTVNIYSTRSRFSSPEKQKESTPPATLISGDG